MPRFQPGAYARACLLLALAGCAPAVSSPPSAPLAPSHAAGSLAAADHAWVERTLRSLTLRERVAQLVMPWVSGEYVAADSPEFDHLLDWVERERVGGVILSIGLPHSYAAKLNELQRRAPLPLLVASDMENGPGMRMAGIYALPYLLPQGGGTDFPPVMALGAAGSDSLAYELGRVLGAEARAVGVHMTFGPVLDVNSNPENPIINTRSFGEDPALVARMGEAYIRGTHAAGLLATGKHFPGHGDTRADSHIELPTITADRARLDRVELVPFRAAVRGGIDGIMTAHIAVVGVLGPDAPPATLSPYFMTDVLRKEMGFDGVLFTDALDMGGVVKRYGDEDAAVRAVEAGADVLLMPRSVHSAIEAVTAAVRSGRIQESRIDASVRRVLEMKARAGLRGGRLVPLDGVDRVVGIRAHTELARRIAERSITLARDDRGLVPLAGSARRILVVTYADPTDMVAGRAFDAALAEGGARVDRARVDDRTTPAELDSLRAAAAGADLVLASVYVSPREHRGSVDARGGAARLFEEIAASGKPLVAIAFGSPYVLGDFPSVPAYLLAWGGAEVSQRAAARALLGESPITGRLPVSLPPLLPRGAGIRRDVRPRVAANPVPEARP
ncbi:MAG: glycoside hydrolase family 3 C-terminal domain-containing protein [Gemmatimonadetes bacterium]|nr:glycoside hydrolase family 3 C-terminal domain-containing protein [Gemmatimonadota bacterium]